MCGRFTLRARLNAILDEFALETALSEWDARYNIAPTQMIPTVSLQQGKRTFVPRRWGLIPSWAADPKIGNSLINARAETVADKPAFRSAFKRHRCLVLTDGFYEWKKEGKAKQPFFIHMKDGRPFAFAGLAEHWSKGEKPIDSATIITTDPNRHMADIHDRMPVILPPEAYERWLDPEFHGKEHLVSLLKPYPDGELVATPVSTLVNSPRNEDPRCIEPV